MWKLPLKAQPAAMAFLLVALLMTLCACSLGSPGSVKYYVIPATVLWLAVFHVRWSGNA